MWKESLPKIYNGILSYMLIKNHYIITYIFALTYNSLRDFLTMWELLNSNKSHLYLWHLWHVVFRGKYPSICLHICMKYNSLRYLFICESLSLSNKHHDFLWNVVIIGKNLYISWHKWVYLQYPELSSLYVDTCHYWRYIIYISGML